MLPNFKVQILLATYNGALFIDDFFKSVISQTYVNWFLLVRDDCSTDETQSILKKWQEKLGSKMKILPDSGQENLGGITNFTRLLQMSSEPYVMFADQDDVWNHNKIELTLDAMLKLESSVAEATPCLVHTDLTLVNEDLKIISSSYWRYQGLHPTRRQDLSRMLVENTVSGCTTMLNRPLANLACNAPIEAIVIDWWVALVAVAFGRIATVPLQTILWRRHHSNDSEISSLLAVTKNSIKSPKMMKQRLSILLEENRLRAEKFLEYFRDRLDKDQFIVIKAFVELPTKNPLSRRASIIRNRLFFSSHLRTIGLIILA